jgi:hypothetical protein
MPIKNPYKRIEEIDKELKPLEKKEKFYRNRRITSKQWRERKDFDEVKSSIFFLVMERNIIKQTIDYFEKLIKTKSEGGETSASPTSNEGI